MRFNGFFIFALKLFQSTAFRWNELTSLSEAPLYKKNQVFTVTTLFSLLFSLSFLSSMVNCLDHLRTSLGQYNLRTAELDHPVQSLPRRPTRESNPQLLPPQPES